MLRFLLLLPCFACLCSAEPERKGGPPIGWTTPVRLVRAIDGDTLEVEIRRTVHVRLLDCWAPESRTRDLVEKARGLVAKKRLAELVEGRELLLFVPGNERGDLTAEITMGRVLGRLWAGGVDVAEVLRAEGHAFADKPALLKSLEKPK